MSEKIIWRDGRDLPVYIERNPNLTQHGFWIEFNDGSSTWIRQIDIQCMAFEISDIKRWAYMQQILDEVPS